MTTLTYSGALVYDTCWCGITHAIPQELKDHQTRQHRDGRQQINIYCPLGHTYIIAGEGEAKKLQRQLGYAQDSLAATRAELDQTKGSLTATKGVVTRMRKRAIAGACQFCHRHFTNVARHMATQHPTATVELP